MNWSGNAPIHRLAGFGEVAMRIEHADGHGMNRLGHDYRHAPVGPWQLRVSPPPSRRIPSDQARRRRRHTACAYAYRR